jgi:hypothetical protein
MALTLHAIFDGQVLRPEESSGLEPHKRYLVTVEEDACEDSANRPSGDHPLTALLNMAEDLGVSDLAERHDDYAHRR